MVRVDSSGKIGASYSEKNVTRFEAIGLKGFPLPTSGTTEANLIIDNNCFCVKLHIVSKDVMKDDLLLGADFLNTVDMRSGASVPKSDTPTIRTQLQATCVRIK